MKGQRSPAQLALPLRTPLIPAAIMLLVALILYLTTLAPGLTWSHYGADGGDLAIAVALGSVPHPTGYPTYLLLASAFVRLPWGDPHARLNVMSAVVAATAVGITVWMTSRLWSRWAGVLAGAALATSALFWSQALITEVYALHALFVVALAAWAMQGRTGNRGRAWAIGGGVLTGLALGNHVSIALLLPGVMWAAGLPRRARALALWMAGALVGLAPYLWLPLRATAHMPLNWGGADTWSGFWWLVTGHLYQHYLTVPTFTLLLRRGQQLAALALDQFGWWGFTLAALALFSTQQGPRATYRWLTLWVVSVSLGWALMYGVTDWPVYTLPAWVVLAPWVAVGIVALIAWLQERAAQWPLVHQARSYLLLAGLVFPLATGLIHAPRLNLRQDQEAVTAVAQVWDAVLPNALVLTDGDRATFGLAYAHFVLGQRPDVRVINRTLWGFAWYRQSLQQYYGDLLPPQGATHLQALLDLHASRPVYLVGDSLPSGLRFVPGGPYYTVHRVGEPAVLAIGRIR